MLEDLLDKLLEWKRWSEENNPEEWGSFVATIMPVVFMCVWWLIHTLHCYITRYLKPWQNIVGNVWSLIYMQHGHSLCCKLHAVFCFMLNNMYMTQKVCCWFLQ
jgi:hypothetical protein